jgi:hypothetical protein
VAELDDEANRLYKTWPVLEHFVVKFKISYKPSQELLLDKAMILWRDQLRFKTYYLGKLVKYRILVHILCETSTGCICNMGIYTAKGKKLEETLKWN